MIYFCSSKTKTKNIMRKNLFALFTALSLLATSFAQTSSVQYHTNHFTSQYGTSGAQPQTDNSKIVVRFTPTIPYPCKLVKLKAWFRNCLNPSQINWVAFLEPTGSANGPVNNTPTFLSTGNYVNKAAGGAQDSAYADSLDLTSQNIILTSGDVYAGVTEHLQTNPFIGIAVDTANTSTPDRNWVYSGAWYKAVNWIFADASWGITAVFVPYVTSVEEENTVFSSVEVFPQPASDIATITYDLKENSSVSISVYNQVGEKAMENVVNKENQAAGNYSVKFPVTELAGGIYFVRLESNGAQIVKKLVVMK